MYVILHENDFTAQVHYASEWVSGRQPPCVAPPLRPAVWAAAGPRQRRLLRRWDEPGVA
jgi:hypothetical protein